MQRRWLVGMTLGGLLPALAIGCLGLRGHLEDRGEGEGGEEGERKKVWSGRSYLAETRVDALPSASATAAGFDAERAWGGYDDWEPANGADPGSSWVYQLTTRYGGPKACPSCSDPSIIFRSSSDGGATWSADQFLATTPGAQNDPILEVAQGGAIYAVWLFGYKPGVTFTKSTDHGRTWSKGVSFTRNGTPRWNDRPVLAISPDGQHVYIGFNASDSYVVASHNFGKTWSAPVKTNANDRYWFDSDAAVAPNGDVYIAAADYSADYTGDVNISVIRSHDGGITWQTLPIDVSSQPPDCAWAEGCYLGFLGPEVSVDVDLNGKVMVAYNAGTASGAPQRLFVRSSSDNGTTWSPRQELSVSDLEVDNGFPALAAGPVPGDFRVVWMDDRNGPTTAWNLWYRRTTDGGASWSQAVRLSDQGSGAPYKAADGFAFPYGDYLELSVDGSGTNHVIWGEGSSYTGPGGTWYTRGQ